MLPQIRLERFSGAPLHDQLSGALRRMIHSGELPPGTRLPSTRAVGRALKVSRQIVVLAYEQLQREGYLRAGVGAGTWVAESLRPHLLPPAALELRAPSETAAGPTLSRRGEMLVRHRPPMGGSRPTLPFRPSGIAAEYFPTRTWLRLSAGAWRAGPHTLVQYGDVQGYRPLREAIADYLIRHRGVRTAAEQILVTSGSQQSLEIIARMVLDEGDLAAVEDPCYDGVSSVLRAAGAVLVPVPVDEDGLRQGSAPRLDRVRILYTTPSHQYPLGVTLSLQRRFALVEWARQAGAWIVEDDYDSEFRFESRPLPALQGLAKGGRVIYLGTFSKVLAPGLRIAYMALPEELIEAFVHARQVTDNHPGLPVQAALAEFMTQGHLERHISRMRGVYAERRAELRTALSRTFGNTFDIVPGEAGLHLTMLLGDDIADVEVAALAFERGIDPQPLSVHYVGAERRSGLVVGYGGAAPPTLRSSVSVLDHCIRAVRRRRRT